MRDCLDLSCPQGGRGLTFTSARVLVRAPIDGPGQQRTDTEDCGEVRALTPPLTLLPPHVCHRRRDWAVSVGSHMQQDTVISWSPPRPSAFSCHCSPQRPGTKNGDNVPLDTVVIVVFVSARVLRPAGRLLERTHSASLRWSSATFLKLLPCSWNSVAHCPIIIPKTCFPVQLFVLTQTVRVSEASDWMMRQH